MQIIVFFMLYFMYLYFEENIEFYFLVLLVNEIGKYKMGLIINVCKVYV